MIDRSTRRTCAPGGETANRAKKQYDTMNTNDNIETSASQSKRILAYMRDGHAITSREARELFGCERLAARIADIEKTIGYAPERRRIRVQNRDDKWVYIAQYYLKN